MKSYERHTPSRQAASVEAAITSDRQFRAMIEGMPPLFEQHRHHLKTDVAMGLYVDGDTARLTQALSNILANAAKYTPPEGHIEVSAERCGDQVVVSVRDNGSGIAPELLPHIFERFVQGRQGIDRAQGGLGLGLAIAQRLIEMHEGTVVAQSEGAGRGATFTLALPALVAAASAPVCLLPAAALQPVHSPQSARILIVDDNEDCAALLAEALTLYGYTTHTAYDGPSALRSLATFRPDVALLDIGLPVMDGYELAGHLRQQVGMAALRLIAITGYGQQNDRERAHQAGFYDHFVKPVHIDSLVGYLELMLAQLNPLEGIC